MDISHLLSAEIQNDGKDLVVWPLNGSQVSMIAASHKAFVQNGSMRMPLVPGEKAELAVFVRFSHQNLMRVAKPRLMVVEWEGTTPVLKRWTFETNRMGQVLESGIVLHVGNHLVTTQQNGVPASCRYCEGKSALEFLAGDITEKEFLSRTTSPPMKSGPTFKDLVTATRKLNTLVLTPACGVTITPLASTMSAEVQKSGDVHFYLSQKEEGKSAVAVYIHYSKGNESFSSPFIFPIREESGESLEVDFSGEWSPDRIGVLMSSGIVLSVNGRMVTTQLKKLPPSWLHLQNIDAAVSYLAGEGTDDDILNHLSIVEPDVAAAVMK